MENLGEKISLLRDSRGWTQEDLSVESKVARRTIQNIEGGKVMSPGIDVVMAIAKALGVSISYLIEEKQTRSEVILEIQDLLKGMSQDDLETLKASAENLITLSKSSKSSLAK